MDAARTGRTQPLGDLAGARHRVHGRAPAGDERMPGELPPTQRLHVRGRVQRRRGGRGRRHRRRVHQAGRDLRRQLPRLRGGHDRPRRPTTTRTKAAWVPSENGVVHRRRCARTAARRSSTSTATATPTAAAELADARHRRRRAHEARAAVRTPATSLWRVAGQALHAVGLQLALRLQGRLPPARRGAAAAAVLPRVRGRRLDRRRCSTRRSASA